MKSAKVRLALAASLFVLWIAYLIYLALPGTTPREVLSHAQFLRSTLDVIAYVEDKNGRPLPDVQIEEVIWPSSQNQKWKGRTVHVGNLALIDSNRGWSGSGLYILPLVPSGKDYHVASPPRSPGYDDTSTRLFPRVYQATLQNRRQLQLIPKPTDPGAPTD